MSPDRAPADETSARVMSAALETMSCAFSAWSDDYRLLSWNSAFVSLNGVNPTDLRAQMSLDDLARAIATTGSHPGRSAAVLGRALRRAFQRSRSGVRIRDRAKLFGDRIMETTHEHMDGLGWIVTQTDVTDLMLASAASQRRQHEIDRQRMLLEAAVNNMAQGISMFDAQMRLVICNEPYRRIYRLPERLVKPGTRIEDIVDHLFGNGMINRLTRDSYIENRRQMAERRERSQIVNQFHGRTILVQNHPMPDGGFVTTHEDVTEQRQREDRIRYMARHDALTALANRAQFLEEMGEAEKRLSQGEPAALLCIDLDRFKPVNDTLGHGVGDKLLQEVARRLGLLCREGDVVARLGGDEFALLLRRIDSTAATAAIAERIVSALAQPFQIDAHQISIGASVGIAMAPADGTTSERLMSNADLALYQAKSSGRSGYNFFRPEMSAAMETRRTIESGLRGALRNGEGFHLVFQPLIDLRSDRITCCEALLRWTLPDGTLLNPGQFIPVAEDTGLIVPLGEWVLGEACRAARAWPEHVRVAVNLSAAQFKTNDLVGTVEQALRNADLPARRLELEITESLLLGADETTLGTLHRLRRMGVRICMDDFGTGYSALSYLRSFPFDKIKIDRSFLTGDTWSRDGMAVVRAVVSLGRAFAMSIVAEGIETDEQLSAVRAEGCDEGQGFFFHRGLTQAELCRVLATGPQQQPRLRKAS